MRERSRTVEQQMEASAAEIWAYRLDFTNLPAYNPDVHHLEQLDDGGPDGVGARYRFELDAPGGPHPIGLTVTGSEPERLVAIEMDGALPAREVMTVEDRPEGGSNVAIALTLLIPDAVAEAHDEAMLASGARQVEAELTAMAALLTADRGRS